MKIGSIITFACEQWRVLDIGVNRALIISEKMMAFRVYNDRRNNFVNWEYCSVRKFLNGKFFDSLKEEDKAGILETDIENKGNLRFDTPGCDITRDKIFLLSLEEVDKYFENDESRVTKDDNGWGQWWWLRSPGDTLDSAALVDDEGKVDAEGQYVNNKNGGVRPALWINLQKGMKGSLKMGANNDKATQVIDGMNMLAGLTEFKAYMNELDAIRPYMSKWGGRADFPVQHLLFAVDPGNGCSTAAKILHEYLRESGLNGKSASDYQDYKYKEMEFSKYPDDSNYFVTSEYMKALPDEINEASPGVLLIDIEQWLNHLESDLFTDLLDLCWDLRSKITFIFKVPYLDEGALARVHSRLDDIINVRLIHFHPYTDEELSEAVISHLHDFGINWDKSTLSHLRFILTEERNDRRFHGMQTISKLGTEFVIAKARNASLKLNNAPPDIFTDEDFDIKTLENDERPGFEQLDELIGLTEVKRRISELVVSFKADKKLSEGGLTPPCFHMVFTGSPGTGKTTVARIIGKIFRENGLLRVGDLFEINRFDLVGEYVGQTGPKTVERCRAAMGSIMFIDEAYLLSEALAGRTADFGREAIGALVAEMENHRDKFVVIMAGYEDEMEKLFEVNPGLRGRIPHKLFFPNYTRDELFEIFKMQIEKKHVYDNEFIDKVHEFFTNLNDDFLSAKEFGNARFVRNLIERLRIKALLRLHGNTPEGAGQRLPLLVTDFESAVTDEDLLGINKKETRRRIGFLTESGLQV